jgi:hypothetical protein
MGGSSRNSSSFDAHKVCLLEMFSMTEAVYRKRDLLHTVLLLYDCTAAGICC